jgi:alpha-L-fucosidase
VWRCILTVMKIKLLAGSLAAITTLTSLAAPMPGDPYANETPAQRDTRMAWWREAKFGMFIHWGVYAVPAGNFDGKPIGGIGEWIMLNGKIPVERYRKYAAEFNPVKYDPEAWAALAKEAGMRYMVITSKHHDGFTLFPSEVSKWNIADATPWKKDLIDPLAKAARGQGLKFGLYYSQAQDWTNPGGAKSGYKDGDGWDDLQKGSFDTYIDQVAVPQVREILTRYQPDVLWWDTPHLMNDARAAKIASLLSLKPGLIHNNRLGGGYKGDTETPEQHIPATGFPGRDWETCMTMNDTWGFKSDDHHWKPLSTLITNLVDIASKGGNYLLNVGPTAEGEIPAESIKLLKEVGAWMKVNGESIYGTHASPFNKLPWGRCTTKTHGDDTILYLHVLNWPADGKLTVPGLSNEVKSTELLAGGVKITTTKSDNSPVLELPSTAPDAICSTIKMVVRGKPEVTTTAIAADKDGVIRLLPGDARLDGSEIKCEDHNGVGNIGFWTNAKDSVSWSLRAAQDGKYVIQIDAATPGAGSVLQVQGVGKLACSIPQTGNFETYQSTKIGEVSLSKDAVVTLTLRPVTDGWSPVNVRKVELIPQP